MFEYIFFSVIVLFAILGLAEALHKLYVFFLTPKGDFSSYLITFAKGNGAVQRLRADLARIRWEGKKEYRGLIFLDCGIEESEAAVIIAEANASDDLVYAVKEGKNDRYNQ